MLGERISLHQLAVGAVEHERVAAFVHVHEQFPHPAVDLAIEQLKFRIDVPVPYVVRNFLVIPLQRAGLQIERDNRAGVEIAALAIVTVKGGPRIAHAEIQHVEIGIVGAGRPHGSGAVLP